MKKKDQLSCKKINKIKSPKKNFLGKKRTTKKRLEKHILTTQEEFFLFMKSKHPQTV